MASQSDVRFIDTVCRPTKDRQNAARDLARQSSVVIVVGGANSNNTRELARTCGSAVRASIRSSPQPTSDSHGSAGGCIGITAGTSTPDDVIDRVERRIRELAAVIDEEQRRRDTGGGVTPMMPLAPSRRCWLVVVLFAVAMAWVEAASVLHPRRRRSNRPVSAESTVCRWCAGRGRAREGSIDSHHAVDGRYPGRTPGTSGWATAHSHSACGTFSTMCF